MIGRSGSEPSPAGRTGTGLPWPKDRSPADLVIATQRARIAELEEMLRAALHMKAPTHEFRPSGEIDAAWQMPVVEVELTIRRPRPDPILEVKQVLSLELFHAAGWTLAYALDDACRHAERALGVRYRGTR